MISRIGTHNLNVHDGKARATAFADVLLFTEASPGEVRNDLPDTYEVDSCRWQRSLAVAWRAGTFTATRHTYKPAHPGLVKVTPHRGTYAVLGVDDRAQKTALVVEWRINAARPPYKRGKKTLRRMLHTIHSGVTRRLVKRLARQGYVVHVAGDPNLPANERAYPYLPSEVGSGFDRIGSTEPLGKASTTKAAEPSHPRLTVLVK